VPLILWDACALVKHYVTETGSATVQAIFTEAPLAEMAVTFIGDSETFAILLRRLNQGVIRHASFTAVRWGRRCRNSVTVGAGLLVASSHLPMIFLVGRLAVRDAAGSQLRVEHA
jgi:hypothetical protein